jgi:hypothetical protein
MVMAGEPAGQSLFLSASRDGEGMEESPGSGGSGAR